MKVTDTNNIGSIGAEQPSDSGRPAVPSSPTATPDKVSMDSSAQLSAALASVQQGLGNTRSTRLASIEAAVRQGAIAPDPNRIAQQILDDAELTASLQAMLKR